MQDLVTLEPVNFQKEQAKYGASAEDISLGNQSQKSTKNDAGNHLLATGMA